MRARRRFASAGLALAICAGCAGRVEPVLDLTPWTWTWSQTAPRGWVIRYGFPDDPIEAQAAGTAAGLAGDPVVAAMLPLSVPSEAAQARVDPPEAMRFASFRYGCAREDRTEDAACSVYLDFWLIPLAPPLAAVTPPAYQEHFERAFPDSGSRAEGGAGYLTRDVRGREWVHRAFVSRTGAAFSHYSTPLDRGLAVAVTSYTTRAPDRIVARDLARDAIDRIRIEAAR